jgi:Uma2 family endonuclease
MMTPERAAHALTKLSAQIALREGVRRAGLPCRVFPDGMTVRVAARTAFEPDALVVCPPPTDLNTMEIPNPVIVVEVLSPSTAADDHGVKLDGYFSLGSVHYYLILDADRRVMIHHARGHAITVVAAEERTPLHAEVFKACSGSVRASSAAPRPRRAVSSSCPNRRSPRSREPQPRLG